MKEGQIIENGLTDKVVTLPQNPYTARLLTATLKI
jgi:ABC-type phosphonate transport system ATPase subunit